MKNYTDEVVAACISNLLARLDEAYGEGMHWYGQTPDWYVCVQLWCRVTLKTQTVKPPDIF